MLALAHWLESTALSQEIQKALWLIPLLQTIHIIAIAMVLSSVLMVALRILGVGTSVTMAQTSARYLPWLWTGLALLAVTGAALIIGEPKRALPNPAFQIKMLIVATVVAVVLGFRTSLRRNVAFWEGHSRSRRLTGAFAVIVFLLWCTIAVAGRWIAYMHNA
jgi:hypothetical protein